MYNKEIVRYTPKFEATVLASYGYNICYVQFCGITKFGVSHRYSYIATWPIISSSGMARCGIYTNK